MKHLMVGAVSVDITPKLPVSLVGQYYRRLATEVYSKLRAQILVVSGESDSAIFVACDLLAVPEYIQDAVRREVHTLCAEIPAENIILSAIHTHTAPYLSETHGSTTWGDDFRWFPVAENETTPDAYATEIVTKMAKGVVEAWTNRKSATFATGLDHISISHNRRTVYADGSVVMYGNTNRPDFVRLEGGGDDGIHFMAFEDLQTGKLIGAVIELACPSQVLEHHDYVASDFWEEARMAVAEKWGSEAVLVGLCGAAGDLSPRDIVRAAMPEPDMHVTPMYMEEGCRLVGRKIAAAFDAFMSKRVPEENPDVKHASKTIQLPLWLVTQEQKDKALAAYTKQRSLHEDMRDFTEMEAYQLSIDAGIVVRWDLQQKTKTHPVEVHTIRIGSARMATNPFELFVEYADRIRARSGGGNMIVVQLAGGYQGYLPSASAIEHGGYSALVCNGLYGAEGGTILVEETLDMLSKL
ncbi:MAG: hypothetical protein IJO56_02875 [Oscillospiraceae bacterium]|nr:hypothetical protein [Oscillospiraceae bacterium]